MHRRNKLLALIPALWATLMDVVITIVHQPKEYWSGSLRVVNEANTIGNFIMKQHVSGTFMLCGIWLILIGVLGYFIPYKYSRIFLLFVLIAHSFWASSWLSLYYGICIAILFMLFNAILFYQIEDLIHKNNTKIEH